MEFRMDAMPTWSVMEVDLGLILAGQAKDFDLPFFNSKKIRSLSLTASTAGLFMLTIYSRQARGEQDNVMQQDSSETNQITLNSQDYDDLDRQNRLHITVNNNSAADTNYRLVVKYE